MPSFISAKIYNKLQATYLEHFASNKKQKEKKQTSQEFELEKWNRGKDKFKRQEKSFYYNNHDFLLMGKRGFRYDLVKVKSQEYDEVFRKYSEDKCQNDTEYCSSLSTVRSANESELFKSNNMVFYF